MSEPAGLQELVTALNRLTIAIEGAAQRAPEDPAAADGWEVVPEHDLNPQGDLNRRLAAVRVGDYNGFAELIPECPHNVVTACRRLSGGGVTYQFRAARAFEAGFWARLTLAGLVPKPRATQGLNLRPTVYIVLRARNLASATRVHNASDFYRVTGRLDDYSVSHSFPSLAEAEAYCTGAGVPLPPLHTWN